MGCRAHARQKLFELVDRGNSPLADEPLAIIGRLYNIEREIQDKPPDERRRPRESQARPIIEHLREWLIHQRSGLTEETRPAKAINYSLKRWEVLTRYLDDGTVPIDSN